MSKGRWLIVVVLVVFVFVFVVVYLGTISIRIRLLSSSSAAMDDGFVNPIIQSSSSSSSVIISFIVLNIHSYLSVHISKILFKTQVEFVIGMKKNDFFFEPTNIIFITSSPLLSYPFLNSCDVDDAWIFYSPLINFLTPFTSL